VKDEASPLVDETELRLIAPYPFTASNTITAKLRCLNTEDMGSPI
jgi:hypothetical protein